MSVEEEKEFGIAFMVKEIYSDVRAAKSDIGKLREDINSLESKLTALESKVQDEFGDFRTKEEREGERNARFIERVVWAALVATAGFAFKIYEYFIRSTPGGGS